MALEELESPPPPPPPPPARYAITAPGPVSGGVHGVGFANGHAVVDATHERALAWFRAAPGYSVEEMDPPPTEERPPAAPEPASEPDTESPAEPEPDEAPAVRRKGRS